MMADVNKIDKLFSKKPPLELDEWFVYLVDGEKWYYKLVQDIESLKRHHEARFLGIGRPNQPVHKPDFPTKYLTPELKKHFGGNVFNAKEFNYMGLCCYCETPLNRGINYTKEHVLPVSRGGKNGKNIRPCCFDCNQEKGNLMLHSYIQMLNYKMQDYTGPELMKLKTKIRNANLIAKEVENNG